MAMNSDNYYGLDMHCSMILDQYRERVPIMNKMGEIILAQLKECLDKSGMMITAVEGRLKAEESLAGKLALKGAKYNSIDDITDIYGARVVTFYTDDVDKIAAMIEQVFDIDRENSVDKRKMHSYNSFGYNSLHYICSIPKSLYFDPETPEINTIRFEVQMRTALQHVWSSMQHDIGYKSNMEIPAEHIRTLSRLAGMLELADDEFSRIRTSINEYRYKVQNLVRDGKFDEVELNGDSFQNYLQLKPFERLTKKIAALNQAEIIEATYIPFLAVLNLMGFKTLGDIQRMKKEDSDDAYQLAMHQLGSTDIDIVASTVGLQNLCLVHLLKAGVREEGLTRIFEALNGESSYNRGRAERLVAKYLSYSNK